MPKSKKANPQGKNIKSKAKIKSYNMSFADMAKMSKSGRHAYYTKLRAIAMKRLVRLAGAGYTDSAAYRDFRDAFPKLGTFDMTESDIAAIINQMQDFLNRPDSTVRGQRKMLNDFVDKLHEQYKPTWQNVIKTDENGNTVFEREEFEDKLGRKRTRFKRDERGNKIPVRETKKVGAYDWITHENAREVYKFIDVIRKRVGARLIYLPDELHELWNAYKISKTKNFAKDRNLSRAWKSFISSKHTTKVKSTDPRVNKAMKDAKKAAQEAMKAASAYNSKKKASKKSKKNKKK